MNCLSSFHANKAQNLSCRCPGDFLRVVWRTETKFVHIKISQIWSTEPIFEIFLGSCSYDRFRAILAHCAKTCFKPVFRDFAKTGFKTCFTGLTKNRFKTFPPPLFSRWHVEGSSSFSCLYRERGHFVVPYALDIALLGFFFASRFSSVTNIA